MKLDCMNRFWIPAVGTFVAIPAAGVGLMK